MLARWFFVRCVFLVSVVIAWFALFGLAYVAIGLAANRLSIEWTTVPGAARNVFNLPLVILGFLTATIGAGTYYVVGRKTLRLLRIWDDRLAEYSLRQIRDSRRRGYIEFRGSRRD